MENIEQHWKFEIQPLFPTLLYHGIMTDESHNEVKNAISSLEYQKEFDRFGGTHQINLRENIDIGPFDQDIMNTLNLKSFIKEVDHHLRHWSSHYNHRYTENYRRESWVNKFSYGEYGHIHTHPGCSLSGVYYISVPSNSGNVIFTNPTPGMMQHPEYKNAHYSQTICPVEKKLLLFPSWLPHGITTNTNDFKEDRYSLAFNIYMEPDSE